MANSVKLVLQYQTSGGGSVTHTWNYSKSSPTLANVKAAMTATVTNGAIFGNIPVLAKSAKVVTTTETPFDLNAVMASHAEGDPDLRHLISTTPPDEDEDEDESGPIVEVTETLPYKNADQRKIAELEAELAKLRK